MPNDNKTFIFYASWLSPVDMLTAEEKGEYLHAIATYGISGEKMEVSGRVALALSLVYNDIDTARERYNDICEKRRIAGRKGAEKTHGQIGQMLANGGNCQQLVANGGYNKNKDKEKEKKENKKEKKQFAKPTLEEVQAYINEYEQEKNVCALFNAERWLAFYESNGWMVGKNHMKDWRAAVRTWFGNKDNVRAVSETTNVVKTNTALQHYDYDKAMRMPATICEQARKARLNPYTYAQRAAACLGVSVETYIEQQRNG